VGQARAYHVTLHALEGAAGLRALDRFNLTVAHALSGHVPFDHCKRAADARAQAGTGAGSIERDVLEWLEADVNPIVNAVRSLSERRQVVSAYNLYQDAAKLAITTKVNVDALEGNSAQSAVRTFQAAEHEVVASREANFAILGRLMDNAAANSKLGGPSALRRLSDAARYLGVESSAAAHACAVFEAEDSITVPELAKRLGCGERSLQRRLREEGASAERLRMAARLIRATEQLRSPMSLTEIAVEEGFSDLAHMTRSFQLSCGMTPSALRRVFAADT
jgi:AraC-like DNA-binding protein